MGHRFPDPGTVTRPRWRRRRGTPWLAALGYWLWLTPASATAEPSGPEDPQAAELYADALELYGQEDYDGAAEAAEQGLQIEEHFTLLFVLAQAERKRGNCRETVRLANRFIEIVESERARSQATKVKAECAEELIAEVEQFEPEDEELDEEPLEPVAPPPPASSLDVGLGEETTDADEPTRPWFRDPLGGALVGVGGALVLSGAGMLSAAALLNPNIIKPDNYGEHGARLELRPKLFLGGGIAAGVGALIAAGGGLRWGLLARQQKGKGRQASSTTPVGLGPWIERSTSGVSVRGRF